MLNGVKNIILDLGGVIINLDQELTHTAFQKLFPDNYETLHQESLKINLFEEYEVGNISTNDFIAHFQQFNPVVTPNQIVEAWNSMLLDIPVSRIELINKLKEKYNVYLLSNTNEIHFNHIHNYVKNEHNIPNFKGLFHTAYLSQEIGMRKPSVHIFQYVLGHSKLDPKKTLFIDDSEEHILSAKQLGIKTHHLNLEKNQSLIQLFNEHKW